MACFLGDRLGLPIVTGVNAKLSFEVDQCLGTPVDDDRRILNARNQFLKQCSMFFSGILARDILGLSLKVSSV